MRNDRKKRWPSAGLSRLPFENIGTVSSARKEFLGESLEVAVPSDFDFGISGAEQAFRYKTNVVVFAKSFLSRRQPGQSQYNFTKFLIPI